MEFLNIIFMLPIVFLANVGIMFFWLGLYLRNRAILVSSALNYYIYYSLVLTVLLFCNSPSINFTLLTSTLIANSFTLFYQQLILIFSLVFFVTTQRIEQIKAQSNIMVELHFTRVLIIVTFLALIVCQNLVLLFFLLEVYSLSSYILVAYRAKTSIFSSEASVKYFIVGTVFSLLMIYGIALVYSEFSTVSIIELSLLINSTDLTAKLGLLLISSSVLFKLAAFPFQFWAPDVYEGSPTVTMYFLSIIPKIGLLAILINLYPLLSVAELLPLLVLAGAGSVVYGSVAGVYQKRIKRLLTYSSINSTGFLLIGLTSLHYKEIEVVTFFLIVYLLTSSAIFSILLSNKIKTTSVTLKNLSSLTNLFFTHKNRALILSIFLFSSAGLPPLIGFLTKFSVLLTVSNAVLNYILIVVLLVAPLSVFYYIRIAKVMFFSKKQNFFFLTPFSKYTALLVSVVLSIILVLLMYMGPFLVILSNMLN